MHFDHIPALLIALAGTAVGSFVVGVLVDDALGVVLAIREGNFDWHKLPSFLESQFGTKAFVAVVGLALAAGFAPGADLRSAFLAALTAGATATTASVAADVRGKILTIAASFR